MATYAIGDIQGCCDALERLLDELQFDPASDLLWFCGDLVNRGGQSLEVLRLVKSLGDRAIVVLGNHDLHLLAQAVRPARERNLREELHRVLQAPDGDGLLAWLRERPILHVDHGLQAAIVHGGIAPGWDMGKAQRLAGELESALRGEEHQAFFANMYGAKPDRWDDALGGRVRLRAITNVFTRMRYCDRQGRIAFGSKGPPGTQPPGYYPWFRVPGRKQWPLTIYFGHWSALGFYRGEGVVCLDSGYSWGGSLTAVDVEDNDRFYQIAGRPPTGV